MQDKPGLNDLNVVFLPKMALWVQIAHLCYPNFLLGNANQIYPGL